MRQNSEIVNRQNLLTELQATHSANILSGLWIIKAFTLEEFHGGIDPDGQNENPIFQSAAMLWAEIYNGPANVEDLNDEFDSTLSRYTKLLTAFSAYLSDQKLTEEQTEVTRIQLALAAESAEGALVALRDSLLNTQPENVTATLAALGSAANVLKDDELIQAVADVRALETNDPAFMEKFCDLLVVAEEAISYLEMLAQIISAELTRHQSSLKAPVGAEGRVCQ